VPRPDDDDSTVGTLNVATEGVTLSGEQAGEGMPVLLLHGLTATRRYVVMGSRALERAGHRVIAYDARGHGRSQPAPSPADYGYARLADDALAVLDAVGVERAVLAGASMGAHTAVRVALTHPERVLALGLITPSYEPGSARTAEAIASYDRLARGLREGGVEGFVAAYPLERLPEAWRETVTTVLRQRLGAHEHPLAVADALEAVPRSQPFEDMDQLARITVPTLVVASRDEADPEHPLAVGERYARTIPGAELLVEMAAHPPHPPRSPLAWQGGQLSKALAALSTRVARSRG
jgi:pimeloyl-ACP methyl ester carboxylesterase